MRMKYRHYSQIPKRLTIMSVVIGFQQETHAELGSMRFYSGALFAHEAIVMLYLPLMPAPTTITSFSESIMEGFSSFVG